MSAEGTTEKLPQEWTFEQALSLEICGEFLAAHSRRLPYHDAAELAARTILTMPEMQAVRHLIDVLEANAQSIPFAEHCLSDLPDNLREWARRERLT